MSKERSKMIDFIYYNTYTIISYTYISLEKILKISMKSKSEDRILKNSLYYNIL